MTSNREAFLESYLSSRVFDNANSLDDFKLRRKMGFGAFSKVYKAKQRNINKDFPEVVALKIMSKKTLSKLSLTSKVVNEAKLLSCLSHGSIIKYYTSFETMDTFNIVLECLLVNLYTILQKQVYFGESAVRFVSSQIVLGLQYLHSFLVAYRDLKPENILLTVGGCVKLTDLSFAKYIPGRSYTCQGTLEYMAPEILLNQGHGLSVDLWALGVLLYELCAGYSPFKSKYQLSLIQTIVSGRIQFPPHFSEELRHLIKQLLVVNPINRLGCKKGKEEELKNHPWFGDDVEWDLEYIGEAPLPKELSELEMFDDDSEMSDVELSSESI